MKETTLPEMRTACCLLNCFAPKRCFTSPIHRYAQAFLSFSEIFKRFDFFIGLAFEKDVLCIQENYRGKKIITIVEEVEILQKPNVWLQYFRSLQTVDINLSGKVGGCPNSVREKHS